MSDSLITYLRLPKPMKKEVEKVADKECQTVSTTLRMLIRKGLDAMNGKAK